MFTNLPEAPAQTISLIYRYRWRVELFFKWLKCILGRRQWLAESPTGVLVQVYCALIASVLIVLWTDRKPTKRQWEALHLYWIGWAKLGDLERIFSEKKLNPSSQDNGLLGRKGAAYPFPTKLGLLSPEIYAYAPSLRPCPSHYHR